MTTTTLRAQVRLVGSGIAEDDLGQKDITLRKIAEKGRDVGFYVDFSHNGKTVSGSVAEISPDDWEKQKVTPIVRVNRSFGI